MATIAVSLLLLPGASATGLGIVMSAPYDGNFSVQLGGSTWFESGDVFVRDGWEQLSCRAGTLAVLTATHYSGSDAMGAYDGWNATFGRPSDRSDGDGKAKGGVLLATSVREYSDGGTLIFESSFPNGLAGCQQPGADESRAGLATSFPSFQSKAMPQQRRGWVTYDGWDCRKGMAGCVNQGPSSNPHVSLGTWGDPALGNDNFPGGLEGSGPLAVFADDGTSGTVVLSALESPMATSSEMRALAPERPPAPPPGPTPPPTPGATHAWVPHAGMYCAGSDSAWAANNVSRAACQAKADELDAPCFDFRYGWPPPEPYCQNCRVGSKKAGKLKPTGQNYTAYVNADAPTPAPPAPAPGGPQTLAYGLLGTLTAVPPGFRASVVLSTGAPGQGAAAPHGIGDTVRGWGLKMQQLHGRDVRGDSGKDFTNTHLGFDTDNGAYYYYNTEPNKNYEDTLVDVKRYADTANVPVRHLQLDSWWYVKGKNGGTKTWVSQPDQFPHGLPYLQNATGWPITAHNRMWAPDTTYSRANGGGYDFHEETGLSLPLESRFWDDLFANASAWGLYNYEQDWLYTEYVGLNLTLSNATAASTWLTQMGEAAARAKLTMQFCMAWPRFLLHALSLPAVTQARASADYRPGNEQWRVGMTSLFIDALGLRPTKDSFWSNASRVPDADGKMKGKAEPFARLQGAVSTLSMGPTFISGALESWDAALIMRSCRADGRLLQPDRAASAVDVSLLARAGFVGGDGKVNPDAGEVWAARSDLVGAPAPFTQLLAADVAVPLSLAPADLGYGGGTATLLVFEANASSAPRAFDAAHPIAVTRAATKLDFTLHHVVPVLPASGWALLGEAATKWVPVSTARFSALRDGTAGFTVAVAAAAGERVEVMALAPGAAAPQTVVCSGGEGGAPLTLALPAGTCL